MLSANPGARVFAGSTDILPQARAGRSLPEFLMAVGSDETTWSIGAATPAVRLTRDEALRADIPGLVEAAGLIGSDQIQTRASLGGNLCNASPAADTGPALVVNEARAVVASSGGERLVPVAEITTGPGTTSLREGEFIVEFVFDRPGELVADAYQRFTPRSEMDIAVVGAAARVTLAQSGEVTDAAVVLGAVAPTTMRVSGIADALIGRALDDEALEEAAGLSREQAQPITDKRGTKEFRVHIAGVLTKRVLRSAAERAATKR